jgi:hypothetical protein
MKDPTPPKRSFLHCVTIVRLHLLHLSTMRSFTLLPHLLWMCPVGDAFKPHSLGRIRHWSFGSTRRGAPTNGDILVSLSMQSSQQQRQDLRTVFGSSSTSTVSSVGILLAVATLILSAPPAFAGGDNVGSSSSMGDPSVIIGEYSDPQHPHCRRTIQVDKKDGTTIHFSGTQVGSSNDYPTTTTSSLRGCSPNEIQKFGGLRTERIDGKILPSGGLKLNIGHGIEEGVWEPANSVMVDDPHLQFKEVDGIRWNDGTKWIVKNDVPKPLSTVVGEWIFLTYIGFSTLAGVKGVWDKIQEKRNRAI